MTLREAEILARTYDAVDLAMKTGKVHFVWEDQGAFFVTDYEPGMDYAVILATVTPEGTVE